MSVASYSILNPQKRFTEFEKMKHLVVAFTTDLPEPQCFQGSDVVISSSIFAFGCLLLIIIVTAKNVAELSSKLEKKEHASCKSNSVQLACG